MNLYSIPPLITSLLLLSLGIFVYSKNRRNPLNRVFFPLCLTSGVWLFFYSLAYNSTSENMGFLCLKIGYCGIIFIAVIFFHYTKEFLEVRKMKGLVLLNYLMGILWVFSIWKSSYFIKGIHKYFWGYYPLAGSLHPIFLIFFIGLISFSLIFLLYYFLYQKEKLTPLKTIQIKYLFLAFFIFNFASLDFLPNYGIKIYPFGYLPALFFTLIIAYSILRYRLMDINIVIKKTVVYSLSAGLLASFFVVFVLAMTKYLSNLAGITSFTITVIAALIIALLFNPLRNRIQTIIDRIFYKKTYDYYATIQKVSHELASTFNLRKIYSFVGDTIFSTLGLKNIYLLFAIPGGSYGMVYSTSHGKDKAMEDEEAMEIDEESKIVKYLMDSEDVVIREELPHIHKISQEVIDNVNADLKPFKGEVVVPAFIDGKLELLMVLGEKLSGDIFTDEDIKLLNTISDQTAVAIKNARLYEEKVRSEGLASIGMMSATFAHEIKTPLTSIKTFAQLLPERYSDIDFRDNFSKIVMDSVNRIDGLIADLIGLSSGRISAEMRTLNITGLIDQIIDEVKANLELKREKINIEKDYKNISVDVWGDEKRLRQAFINIIMNGCQAIPEGQDDGTLKVSINPNEENVDISITDNGDGVPAEDVTRLFEPFFSTKTIGAGLGLAITKKIIEDHCGKITVESRFKKGTTFIITLPIKKMEAKGGNLSTT